MERERKEGRSSWLCRAEVVISRRRDTVAAVSEMIRLGVAVAG